MSDDAVKTERAALGAAMMSRRYAEELTERVPIDDFAYDLHRRVAETIGGLLDDGVDPNPNQVAARLPGVDRLTLIGWDDDVAFGHYALPEFLLLADEIIDRAGRRRLGKFAAALDERLKTPGVTAAGAREWAIDALDSTEIPTGEAPETMDEFLAAAPELDWLVDGLLARGDRVLLVAQEGYGKSSFLRQMAVMLSQGIHPTHPGHRIDPCRVLYVDLENAKVIAYRQVARLKAAALDVVGDEYQTERIRMVFRPEGIDVTHRPDAWWLTKQVAAARPDVLVIGPAYKMHESAEEKSEDVRQVLKVLDRIRTRWNCALLMETHAPHESFAKNGTIRPAGSRLWLRWPELVMALAPRLKHDLDGEWTFSNVRQPRDRRSWPKVLVRGQTWPWEIERL